MTKTRPSLTDTKPRLPSTDTVDTPTETWGGWPLVGVHAHGEVLGEFRIKQVPEDFRVTEDLGFVPSGVGEHVYLQVAKRGANTGWVAEQLARFAGIRHFDVGFSGRKDRHAVTEQWFSCWLPRAEPDWDTFVAEGFVIRSARRHERKLRKGTHVANLFDLRLRGLGAADAGILEQRLALIAAVGVPNYFMSQRFGHDAGNLDGAMGLFTGKLDPRRCRQKDLYLSAARAFLFNRVLDCRVRSGEWHLPGLMGPLPGDAPLDAADAVTLLDHAALWQGLAAMRMQPGTRPLAVVPDNFRWAFEGDDVLVSFQLAPGSFATAVLRELGVQGTGIEAEIVAESHEDT